MIIKIFVVLQDARKACSDSTLSQVRLPSIYKILCKQLGVCFLCSYTHFTITASLFAQERSVPNLNS